MSHTKIIRIDNLETLFLHADPDRSFTNAIKVPDHPIDGEKNVTDHAQSELKNFNIVGEITSLGLVRGDAAPSDDPLTEARDFFRRAEGQKLRVVIPRRGQYSPCLLQSWDNIDKQSVAIEFDLSFKIIRIASAETVEIPPDRTPDPGLASESDKGGQATTEYFTPEVPPEFQEETSQFAEDAEQAKGRKTDTEVVNQSLASQGLELVN